MDNDGHVTIGCDSRLTFSDKTKIISGKPKIIKLKDTSGKLYILGHAGYFRALEIIENELIINSDDTIYSICQKIKNILCMNDHSNINDGMNETDSSFIICSQGFMSVIGSDYGYFIPDDKFLSIGSSKIFAISSNNTLELTNINLTPIEKIKVILSSCRICDGTVGPPYHIYDTEGFYEKFQ